MQTLAPECGTRNLITFGAEGEILAVIHNEGFSASLEVTPSPNASPLKTLELTVPALRDRYSSGTSCSCEYGQWRQSQRRAPS